MYSAAHTEIIFGTKRNLQKSNPQQNVQLCMEAMKMSVKPWDMLTDAEKKLRVEKTQTIG